MDIKSFILDFENLDRDDVIINKKTAKLAEDIQLDQITVVDLIDHLGSLLVNGASKKRELGLLVLSQVLDNLPANYLNLQQLTFICTFYADRLKDQHVLSEALKGILALLKFDNFPDGAAIQLLSSLFQNVACQQQQQHDRNRIYQIFKLLLDRCKTELCSMGMDFVYGVISSIDAERDPRNLLFLFKWIPSFLRTVSLRHLADEMFEVLSCYFPVDFRTPPQDTNAITRDALAEALCPCLCAIPEFAEPCLALSLEKLDSSLEIAKIDSLHLLTAGCKTFPPKSYQQRSTEIWSTIQKELLNCSDRRMEVEYLQTLEAVVNRMSQGNEDAFKTMLKDITDTAKRNFLAPSKLFSDSAKLLVHTALASEVSALFVVKEVLPVLTTTFNIASTPDHMIELLRVMIQLFKACQLQILDVVVELQVVPVLALKASIHTNSKVRCVGFDSLSDIAESLPANTRSSIYENLRKLLVEPQPAPTRQSILICLRKLATIYCEEINVNVVTPVQTADLNSLDLQLNALCELVAIKYFTEIVIGALLSNAFENMEIATVYLRNIRKLLDGHTDNAYIQQSFLDKNIVSRLIQFTISAVPAPNESFLWNVSEILKNLVGFQTVDVQNIIVQTNFKVLYECKISSECVYVALLDGVVARLHRDVPLDYNVIIEDLLKISLKHCDGFVRAIAVQLLANLINKCAEGKDFEDLLRRTKDFCIQSIEINSGHAITILCWITKALFMRNHWQASEWSNLLIDLLDRFEAVAEAFRIILNDDCDCLNPEKCYCTKMVLYRQKFFTLVTNSLSLQYTAEKTSYLLAIGYLLESAPRQAVIFQFKKILKLIVHCLEQCKEPNVLCVILQTLKQLIVDKEALFEDHLEDFLLRIIDLTVFDLSMKVRIEALQCLQHYTTLSPVYKLLPHKPLVVKRLGQCIDDKKRFVRKEAVLARSLWFLLDAPI